MEPEKIAVDPAFRAEVDRRRTFCIISHPDAGKTTLTEQLLLLGGAIRLAGDVRARKSARFAASDWMAIEQERGISVTSSVMKYGYRGRELNLLDTPGHEDFSEDTYRVLTAVDSALMVIDSVKGVESRTRQLMEVCRMRDTPIVTFINKLDREGRDPFELLAEIEESLGIHAVPLTWPIGRGSDLKGTYHLESGVLSLFSPRRSVVLASLDDPALETHVGPRQAAALRDDVELLVGAGERFDVEAYLAGRQTPVVFGSAVNGFGVDHLLDAFVEMAPAPKPRPTATRDVSPYEPTFSGVVFKVQANMDPAHRDRVAFLRVCSGKFERGIRVRHGRTGKEFRIPNAVMFLAQDREGVEEAYPGDIIGIPNHGTISVGDTFAEQPGLRFTGIPNFAPEHFRRIRLDNALRAKHLEKGLIHLNEEGAIQVFRPLTGNDFVLGAIGPLQFDVVAARLEREYNVTAHLSALPYEAARWVEGAPADLDAFTRKVGLNLYRDLDGDLVFLAESPWRLQYVQDNWKQITFHATKERT